MKKQFTEKDLVDFGNYLLSNKRQATIENKDNINQVHDVDLANFKQPYIDPDFESSFLLEGVESEKEYFDYDWSLKREKVTVTITYVSNRNTSKITAEMITDFFINLDAIKEINPK